LPTAACILQNRATQSFSAQRPPTAQRLGSSLPHTQQTGTFSFISVSCYTCVTSKVTQEQNHFATRSLKTPPYYCLFTSVVNCYLGIILDYLFLPLLYLVDTP
jgi:hypothetical protein